MKLEKIVENHENIAPVRYADVEEIGENVDVEKVWRVHYENVDVEKTENSIENFVSETLKMFENKMHPDFVDH